MESHPVLYSKFVQKPTNRNNDTDYTTLSRYERSVGYVSTSLGGHHVGNTCMHVLCIYLIYSRYTHILDYVNKSIDNNPIT